MLTCARFPVLLQASFGAATDAQYRLGKHKDNDVQNGHNEASTGAKVDVVADQAKPITRQPGTYPAPRSSTDQLTRNKVLRLSMLRFSS